MCNWSVRKVRVDGLFGELDHEFQFEPQTNSVILIGPNGVGKTKLLGLLRALINLEISTLLSEPFREITVDFRGGERLRCIRDIEAGSRTNVQFYLITDNRLFDWNFSSEAYNRFEDWASEHLPVNRKREGGSKQWRLPSGFVSTDKLINHVLTEQGSAELNKSLGGGAMRIKTFLGAENAMMIRADRLTNVHGSLNPVETMLDRHGTQTGEGIASYIRGEFESARMEYLKVSQTLDSTFPGRLLEKSGGGGLQIFESETDLRAVYDSLRELFRETTGNVGIDSMEMAPLPERQLEQWEIRALNLHVQDGLEKIEALTNLSRRIEVFEELVNSKLVRSEIQVRPSGVYLKFGDGSIEPPRESNLSSGERHQIQMAFDLVFRSRGKKLVLVDEPELSLHVNWQTQILDEFESLQDLNKFQYVVATHSPEIIGDAWGSVRPLTFGGDRGFPDES